MTYKIITDGSSDLSLEFLENENLVVIPMDSTIDGKNISFLSSQKELLDKYYENMLLDKEVFTTQVNQKRFEEYFSKVLEEGYDIIYTGISKGISGTFSNAINASEVLKEEYPQRKITVLDPLTASTSSGLLIQTLLEFKQEGMEYEKMISWINENYKYIVAQFGVDDLKYLYKGGRVSKTTAGVGNLLKVKPMLHMDDEGKLQILGLNRGTKNNMKNIVKNFEKLWDKEISNMVVIGYAYYEENAQMLKEMLEEKVKDARIYIAPIGSLIGTHVGPGMYSLCYFGKNRK